MRRGIYSHTAATYRMVSAALAALNANTQGGGVLGPCPEGYCWYIERWTQHIAATAVFELLVSSENVVPDVTVWDKTNRVQWTATSVDAQADLASPIYVGPGEYLIGLWSSGTSGNKGVATFQVSTHELEEHYVARLSANTEYATEGSAASAQDAEDARTEAKDRPVDAIGEALSENLAASLIRSGESAL